ncbi:MAG: gamma-glutamyltransferase [Hyphomicrobiales bacterium]
MSAPHHMGEAPARDFQLPGRSTVMAMNGMAATSHPLATGAAVDVLRQGGNAVDAAVTAAAVLAVVEPHMTGIGGDCFAIVAEPDGAVHGINGSGRAPATATLDWYLERGFGEIGPDDIHAVTVPGAVATWAHLLETHGSIGLDRALAPAISYAEAGFPVAPRVASDWARLENRLRNDEGARAHYLVAGRRAPEAGEVMRAPALAASLRAIAAKGRAGFYEGEIAEDIVATVQARGGLLSLDDMATMTVTPVDPVTRRYRDLEIAELPPNGQGITALIQLGILENFDMAALDPMGPERLHLEIEAARLAYACRDAHIADPATMRLSVAELVDPAFTARLAARIDRRRRMADPGVPEPSGSDTIYLTVVDRDRRVVSLINSIFHGFGVGVVTLKSGITLQNRGSSFRLIEGHPNAIGPGKRPMHTIIPAMAFRDGRPAIGFGVMGGAYQACGHAHFVSNIVDHAMDVQLAIDAPRAFWNDQGRLGVERGLSDATFAGLAARGHLVYRADEAIGGGQAIAIDWERGVLVGGSDPRKDGLALGY